MRTSALAHGNFFFKMTTRFLWNKKRVIKVPGEGDCTGSWYKYMVITKRMIKVQILIVYVTLNSCCIAPVND